VNAATLATAKGVAKSVTMYAAGILLALGQVAPFVNESTMISLGLHGRSLQISLTVAGLVMAACRAITTKSLADKGTVAPAAPPAPPAA
jgi:hypothetical protein